MFDGLLEHIHDLNEYFDKGYEGVYQDENTGIVHEQQPVFPADNLGDYFYLRLPDSVTFEYGDAYNNEEGANKPAKLYNLVLVACVKNADPDKLINNMIVSLSKFKRDVTIQSAVIESEKVIQQELAFMSEDNRTRALQNKPENLTIISVSFSFVEETLIDCIVKPCKDC